MSGVTQLKRHADTYRPLAWALVCLSAVSVGFFVVGAISNRSLDYWYLVWNLSLAWLPLVFAVWLIGVILPKYGWNSGRGVVFTLLWLGFVPNSFYITSDLIHLGTTGRNDVLYDSVMLLSFAINGLILGFISLYLIHQQLLKRLTRNTTHTLVALILLLCSFAIYLGRDLRWNSWDILINPAGILFDVSDRLINPWSHPQTFTTTLTFFTLLGSLYIVVWQLARLTPPPRRD